MRLRGLTSKYCARGLALWVLCDIASAQNNGLTRVNNALNPSQDIAISARNDDKSGAASDSVAPDLRIGPGDLLEIKVFGAPDLSGDLRVSNAGEITVALIGNVRVSGTTPEVAQTTIEKRLVSGGYLRDRM